jgi:hypothetical protein
LKAAKKLRDILKLEDKRADGDILDKTQQVKLASRSVAEADFIELQKMLPSGSGIVAKVQDVFSTISVASAEPEPDDDC